jgi:hypothetical protein
VDLNAAADHNRLAKQLPVKLGLRHGSTRDARWVAGRPLQSPQQLAARLVTRGPTPSAGSFRADETAVQMLEELDELSASVVVLPPCARSRHLERLRSGESKGRI